MLPANQINDDDQEPMAIQREVGAALQLAFEAAVHEPLPQQIALPLLHLALAESLTVVIQEYEAEGETSLGL